MSKSILRILTIITLPLLGVSNAQDTVADPDPAKRVALPDPVAVVDGEAIPRADLQRNFDNVLANMGRAADSLTEEQQLRGYRGILEDMVLEKILDKKTVGTKADESEVEAGFKEIRAQFPSEEVMNEQIQKSGQSMEAVREAVRAGVIKQKWIESQIADQAGVTKADAEEFYKSNSGSFDVPETVRASHILVQIPEGASEEVEAEKKQAIEAAASRLQKGEDFAEVAKDISEDPGSKDKGGDLDFFAKERMVPEFANVAFAMEKGQISDPVKSQFGYHIIKVTDKRLAHTVPFAEAEERITEFLGDQKRRTAINELIADLREKADVKIFLPEPPAEPALPAPPAADE